MSKDKAYRFMKNVRGSPAYYRRTFYDLLVMMRQLDTPMVFAVADLSPGMHGLLPFRQNREIIVFHYEL